MISATKFLTPVPVPGTAAGNAVDDAAAAEEEEVGKKTHFGRVLCLLPCLIFLLCSLWPKASQIYEPDWLAQHPPPTPTPPAACVPRYRPTRPRPHAWESDYLRRMRLFSCLDSRVCLFPALFGGHVA